MAINYASKFAPQIDERFTKEALSTPVINTDFDFTGVKSVSIYSVPTAEMHDYTKSGASRYGTPTELENSVQELTMSQDRSFTFTIDKGNFTDTQMANSAGQALQRQLTEVVIPEVDIYRFGKICDGASTTVTSAITSSNAYSTFLDGQQALMDLKAPVGGRVAYVSSNFYKLIKQDDSFIKSGDLAQNITIKGQVGSIDGIPIVPIPTSYMPNGVEFFITNKIACTAPTKLSEYKIHDNPPGINGWLVEGRLYYDAFVLNNKANAIYVHRGTDADTLGDLTVTSVAGTTSGDTKITVTPSLTTGNSYKYKTGVTLTTPTYNQVLKNGWTVWDGTSDITATTGNKIIIAEVDANSKVEKVGQATVTSKA